MSVEEWPVCAVCTMAQGTRIPVEGYDLERSPGRGARFRERVSVTASCGHRGSNLTDHAKRDHQTAHFDVPVWWGTAHVQDAIAGLVFFKPGDSRVDHGMVTDIGAGGRA